MTVIFLLAFRQGLLGTGLWLPDLYTSYSCTLPREIQAQELNAGCQISISSENITLCS